MTPLVEKVLNEINFAGTIQGVRAEVTHLFLDADTINRLKVEGGRYWSYNGAAFAGVQVYMAVPLGAGIDKNQQVIECVAVPE